MTPAAPSSRFPGFYGNPAVRALAPACRWSISGRLGDVDDPAEDRKAPIDVRHLIDGCDPWCRHSGPLRGAYSLDRTCLVTLDELSRGIPDAANAAFYLQAQTDGLMVLDVEPGCPRAIASSLLALPGVLYSELSMSGDGYHLLVPLPDNFRDHPVAATKRVLREEHGWYELLLEHWVTFTRTPVPEGRDQGPMARSRGHRFATVADLYADLAAKARKPSGGSATDVRTSGTRPEIVHAEDIVDRSVDIARHSLKSPDDFAGDMSRWEFSVLASLHGAMRTVLAAYSAIGVAHASDEVVWMLHDAALRVIPPRPKHAQTRNGRPFLLDRAAAMVADRERPR